MTDKSEKDVVTIETEDGYSYTGEVSNEVPDGQGVLTHPDGGEYAGKFFNGRCQRVDQPSAGDQHKPLYFRIDDFRIGIEIIQYTISGCSVEVFPCSGPGSPQPSVLRPRLWESATFERTVGGGAIFYQAFTNDPNDILYLLPHGSWDIYRALDVNTEDYFFVVEKENPGIDYGGERQGLRVDDVSDLPQLIDEYVASRTTDSNFSHVAGRLELGCENFFSLYQDVAEYFGRGEHPGRKAVCEFLDEKYGSDLIDKRTAEYMFAKALGEKQGAIAFKRYVEDLGNQSEEVEPGDERLQFHNFLTMGKSAIPLTSIREAIDTYSERIRTEK